MTVPPIKSPSPARERNVPIPPLTPVCCASPPLRLRPSACHRKRHHLHPLSIPIPIPAADLTPTPLPPILPAPIPPPALSLPNGIHLTVSLDSVSAGWASDLDGRMHWDVADIHAGYYRGYRYVGGLQFDVEEAAAQGELLYAALELTVRDSTPANLWTATATATATVTPTPTREPVAVDPSSRPQPVLVPVLGTLAAPAPTPTPTPPPDRFPQQLLGKIAFYSDRTGNAELYVTNPDGTGLARLTDSWFYEQAVKRDRLSADQRFRAFVRSAPNASGSAAAVFAYDDFYKSERPVSQFGKGIAYDPVWSPISEQIALVSNDTGNDEIWLLNRDGTGLQQLTQDSHSWWDKHPSWSPDGHSILFWSNRSGQRQLWLMAADGSGQTRLTQPDANNWDPVWIKYPDPPRYPFDE